jgi:hypothetical protein
MAYNLLSPLKTEYSFSLVFLYSCLNLSFKSLMILLYHLYLPHNAHILILVSTFILIIISALCKRFSHIFHKIIKIRSYLDYNTAIVIATSLIHSRLGYRNFLCPDLPTSQSRPIVIFSSFSLLLHS